jgi:hypothetical protein
MQCAGFAWREESMKRSLEPDAPTGLPHAVDESSAPISNLQSPISNPGSFWGVIAGLTASLCCLGPSAAVLLGLGSASALAGIQLDRTLALACGAALLIGGAALALRPGRACDIRPSARWRRLSLMMVAFALAYGLLGMLLPELAARRVEATEPPTLPAAARVAAPAAPHADSAPRRATLIIEKMECPPCAAHVRSLLGRKPFVRAFVAESGNQQVVIDYDSLQIDALGLARLFPHAYRVTLISDERVQ